MTGIWALLDSNQRASDYESTTAQIRAANNLAPVPSARVAASRAGLQRVARAGYRGGYHGFSRGSP
jgi:hypothetical protein